MNLPRQIIPTAAPRSADQDSNGFTLVELLVTMVVLLILSVMMVTMTSQTSRLWKTSRARIDAFQAARTAFERITDRLSQATLNTYLDYYNSAGQSRTDVLRSGNPSTTFTASTYDRASDLQFVCGQAGPSAANGATGLVPTSGGANRPTHALFFQAPLGYVSSSTSRSSDFKVLNTVLNAVGYYVDFSNDTATRPAFIVSTPVSWRYRLTELDQPSQNLGIYFSSSTSAYSGSGAWFYLAVNPTQTAGAIVAAPTIVLADNIVALVVRPEAASTAASGDSTTASVAEVAPFYAYDTKAYAGSSPQNADGTVEATSYYTQAKNQLPPLVQVTMVALDADSGTRLASMFGTSAPPLYANSPFVDVKKYTSDLSALESVLQGYHLNYHVFVADVSVFGAQWSQTNSP